MTSITIGTYDQRLCGSMELAVITSSHAGPPRYSTAVPPVSEVRMSSSALQSSPDPHTRTAFSNNGGMCVRKLNPGRANEVPRGVWQVPSVRQHWEIVAGPTRAHRVIIVDAAGASVATGRTSEDGLFQASHSCSHCKSHWHKSRTSSRHVPIKVPMSRYYIHAIKHAMVRTSSPVQAKITWLQLALPS